MKHFVQYHNMEKMRYSATEAYKKEGFYILTRKMFRPEEEVGQTIW